MKGFKDLRLMAPFPIVLMRGFFSYIQPPKDEIFSKAPIENSLGGGDAGLTLKRYVNYYLYL